MRNASINRDLPLQAVTPRSSTEGTFPRLERRVLDNTSLG